MNDIVIKDFSKGIAESPHLGFADLRNVTIDEETGVLRIEWDSVKVSGAVITNRIKWIVNNEAIPANYYAIDASGDVYTSGDSGGSWASSSNRAGFGEGAVVWKDYLLVTTNTGIDAFGPLSGSAVWIENVMGATIATDALFHPMITGQDDIVYIGAGRYVASLQEVDGQNFQAGTASTFTFSAQALDLPEDYRVKCIAELGKNLMIGTWKGATASNQAKTADIFPWDRKSDSFNLPLRLAENGINQMISMGGLVYFQAGSEGKIFVTDGTSIKLIGQIPKHITNLVGAKWIEAYPGAMIFHKGKILFGIMSPGGNGQEVTDGIGVWSINPDTKALVFENQISTGSTGGVAGSDVQITALKSVDRNSYLIGWEDGNTYGIDKISNTIRYTGYKSFATSAYYPLGTKQKPVPLSEIEFQLAKPFGTAQGVRLKYRTDLNAAFTTIGTYDAATYGTTIAGYIDTFGVTVDEGIQIRAELTTNSGSTTVDLREIRIR